MDAKTQQFFKNIKEADPLNNKCIDCGAAHPQWASVSHGCLICLTCSGIHRSLGVHISFIRSITMDTWTPKQMKMMELGGNSKLLDIFKEYGLSNCDIKRKYNSRIAAYYRNMLKDISEGKKPDPKPSISTGSLEYVVENNSLKNNPPIRSSSSFSSSSNEDKFANLFDKNIASTGSKSFGNILSNLSSFSMKVLSNTKNYAENTINHVQERGIIESAIDSVRAGSSYIEEAGRAVVEKVQDEKFWSETASTVQNSAQWVNNKIQTGISGVNEVIHSAIDPSNFSDPFNIYNDEIDNTLNERDFQKIHSGNNQSPQSKITSTSSGQFINQNPSTTDRSNSQTLKFTSSNDLNLNQNNDNIKNINLWGNDLEDWEPKDFKKGITK